MGPQHRAVARNERELINRRQTESRLRAALARDEALLRQKEQSIREQDILNKESVHRFLNGLQMTASLLSMQSRASSNAEVAAQLGAAADPSP